MIVFDMAFGSVERGANNTNAPFLIRISTPLPRAVALVAAQGDSC